MTTASGFTSLLRLAASAAAAAALAACTHHPAGAPVQPECTAETPLVPGIPGSPGHLLPSPRNPNGDSELAALMRRFVEDLTASRAALLSPTTSPGALRPRGPLLPVHRRMRCSWPTAPADRTPTFDALAVSYLAQVQALDEAPPEALRAAHGRVVQACQACHEVSCAGPLEVIEGLKL